MTRAAVALLASLTSVNCGAPKPVSIAPSPPPAHAPLGGLQDDLRSIFDTPQFERAFWSVCVRRLQTAENLFSLNAGKLMMPGSAMKILTAAAAAERLGWDHRFETRLVSSAPIEAGVLRGDLIVIGGGDPGISERADHPGTLRAMARHVVDRGITKIEGGIIGHDDLFDDKAFGDGWTLDNLPYGYAAPVSALIYNEGSVDLLIRAGSTAGEAVAVDVRPDGSGLQIDNRLVTVAESGTGMLTLHRLPGSRRVIIQGQIPAKSAPFARTASVDNPTLFFASAFRHALIAEGISVVGDATDIDEFASKPALDAANVLAVHRSLPLFDLIVAMMRVSQNQYAEILLKAIGGRRTVQEILSSWNLSDDGYSVVDGSGLSRYNFVTSDILVRILEKMHADPKHRDRFWQVLPVAGREGTLAKRLAGSPADGRVRAKTGTVDNVRAIAGYLQTADDETLAFSIIANNFTVPNAVIDAAADAALVRLATFSMR